MIENIKTFCCSFIDFIKWAAPEYWGIAHGIILRSITQLERLLILLVKLIRQFSGFIIQCIAWGALILMLFTFVVIMFDSTAYDKITPGLVSDWLGLTDKNDKLKFIGLGISGALATIGAIAISRRANAQVENNKLIEKGHIEDRFKSATENLTNKHSVVRISAFHQFYYLAKHHHVDDFRKNIFDVLCAYLRNMTSKKIYIEETGKEKPTEECQTLLDVLFKSDDKSVFGKFRADLRAAHLAGVNFANANLANADFTDAYLPKADFEKANLPSANFWRANLEGSIFIDAKLWRANFEEANLVKSNFYCANLKNTKFIRANLEDARLLRTNLKTSNLWGANLKYANFHRANLIKANLSLANLDYAHFANTNLRGVDLQHVEGVERTNFREAKVTQEQIPLGFGRYIADWTDGEFWMKHDDNSIRLMRQL